MKTADRIVIALCAVCFAALSILVSNHRQRIERLEDHADVMVGFIDRHLSNHWQIGKTNTFTMEITNLSGRSVTFQFPQAE